MAIRPRSGTDAFRALALITESPGDLTAADIGAHLRKPEPRAKPFANAADYAAWRSARAKWERDRDAWSSRTVRRLVEAGFVEERGPPVISAWFAARVSTVGIDRALVAVAPLGFDGSLTAHVRLLGIVAAGVRSVADVLGPSPSGGVKAVWAELIGWGCIVPPSARFATEAGRAWVEQNREKP